MATITITHSRAEGTLIEGSVKGDGVWEVVRQHRFRPSRMVGLYLPHSRDREADTWRINRAKAALEEAGHTVTVEIDEETRRTFAEAEADRVERAADRADRFSGYADNAARSSDARRKKADDISRRFEFGQPILVGHHSERRARRDQERIYDNMHRSFEDADRAGHFQNRADAAERYEEHRNNPYRTMRRLEKLRAELRAEQRRHGCADGTEHPVSDRHAREVRDLTEEIEYWEELIAKAEADGVKIWRPDDFAPGDFALLRGDWYQVARVNPKTLSIAWNLRLVPTPVMTLEDATDEDGRVGTHTADYSDVRARCPEEAMRDCLADGKVPGTRSARAASAAAPAEDIRRAQAEAKKARPKVKKKRSDPKIPKRLQVRCKVGDGEATLTWLNGNSQPHPDHEPETLTAPEGEKYRRATWSRNLRAQVDELLAERGYVRTGEFMPRQGGAGVVTIEPAPAKGGEPKQMELS